MKAPKRAGVAPARMGEVPSGRSIRIAKRGCRVPDLPGVKAEMPEFRIRLGFFLSQAADCSKVLTNKQNMRPVRRTPHRLSGIGSPGSCTCVAGASSGVIPYTVTNPTVANARAVASSHTGVRLESNWRLYTFDLQLGGMPSNSARPCRKGAITHERITGLRPNLGTLLQRALGSPV